MAGLRLALWREQRLIALPAHRRLALRLALGFAAVGAAVESIDAGDTSARAPVISADELGTLAAREPHARRARGAGAHAAHPEGFTARGLPERVRVFEPGADRLPRGAPVG